MADSYKPRNAGPPHNPGVGELISGKRRWSLSSSKELAKAGYRGWHERGYLPHRDEPDLIQFVTFHLADSFPQALRSEWAHLLEIEDNQQRRKQLENYLDRGCGECFLRQPAIARLVENEIRLVQGNDYELRAWVLMPNHVHLLFKVGAVPMSKLVGNWKKHTGREANKLLRRTGPFWAADYWDTYMRDSGHELKVRRYIENNPAKAAKVFDPKDWAWGSARFRSESGELNLP